MRVRLLGPIEVVTDAGPIALGGPRQKALLARLALEPGRVVAAEVLVDDIWGEALPASPLSTLQVTVVRVRAALGTAGQALVTVPPGYKFDIRASDVDVVEFEQFVERGHAAERDGNAVESAGWFEKAVGLWRGPPLVDLGESPFVERARVRLDETLAAAQESLFDTRLRLGRHADLVSELETLVAQRPFRERLWGQLMLALYRCGRQADALGAYQRCRRHLAEELGIKPGPELQSLEESILLHKPELELTPTSTGIAPSRAPDANERRRARPPRTSLVGREHELEELLAAIEATQLVTITGPGGVGKTRLALEAARALEHKFHHGVAFCDLTDAETTDRVESAIADALALHEAVAAGEHILIQHLTGREVLLVLDNADQAVEAVASLAELLLESCPRVRLLVTSREPLRTEGERLERLDPLGVADENDAAVRLFLERAELVAPRTKLDTNDVLQACRKLDGLPLAIELAAGRLRSVPLEHLVAGLDDSLSSISNVPTSRGTLRDVVEWRIGHLDESSRALLRRLAVFAGGCTAQAAAEVCDIKGDPIEALSNLVERSLVQLEQGDRGPRYRLLETMRADGLARLEEHDELARYRARHLAWCLKLAPHADPGLQGEDPADLAGVTSEIRNIVAALSWSLAGNDAVGGAHLAVAAAPWWVHAGRISEARSWLESAATATMGLPQQPLVQWSLGWLLSRQGDLRNARRALASAGELALKERDRDVSIDVELLLAKVEIESGDLAAGQARLRALTDSLAVEAIPRRRALAHFALGTRSLMAGELPDAAALLEEAIESARAAGMWNTLVYALVGLCQAEGGRRRFRRAQGAITDALATARRKRLLGAMPSVLGAAATLAYRTGDREAARTHFEEALTAARISGDLHAELATLSNLGTMAQNDGRSQEATELFEEALALATRVDDERTAMIITANLAESVVAGTRDTRRALNLAYDALTRARRGGIRIAQVVSLESAAFALIERGNGGDLERAAKFLAAAEAARRELDRPDDGGPHSPIQQALARIRRELGDSAAHESMLLGARSGLEQLAEEFILEMDNAAGYRAPESERPLSHFR
jgi:predicted ATPase/DNA-binding SARP family transcriptional activator